MADKGSTSRKDLESLLGRLTFAATCFPRGRKWLNAVWRSARAAFRTSSGVVILGCQARKGLRCWSSELTSGSHEGVPLACRAAFPAYDGQSCGAIYADASGDGEAPGFGAWAVSGGKLLYLYGEWSREELDSCTIAELELAASTFGLVALSPLVGMVDVFSFTDNTVAMANMRNCVASSVAAQRLVTSRLEWMQHRGVSESAERITSKANLWADFLSRGQVDVVLRQAKQFGLECERVDFYDGWRGLLLEDQPHLHQLQ